MPHLLIIGTDPALRAELSRSLQKGGCQVTARSPANGKAAPRFGAFDAILADPTAIDREPLLEPPDGRRNGPPVIVFAGADDVRQAVRTMQRGAADYLPLPIATEELLAGVDNALLPNAAGLGLGRGMPPFALVGDGAMAEVRKRLQEVAATEAAVLVEGESGTGKTAVAEAVHRAGGCRHGPFITLRCAAIPKAMLEAELFGPNPAAANDGLAAAAKGGTLFLEDIADLPLETQARLASLLPQGGGQGPSGQLELRVVASSHRSLGQLAADGRFHAGLLRCFEGSTLVLPPLRSRPDAAGELAAAMLLQACRLLNKTPARLSEEAVRAIGEYRWPGNLRELGNVVERAAMLCEGGEVGLGLLAIDVTAASELAERGNGESDSVSLDGYFVAFVLQNQDQMTETELAAKLGISRKNLWERRRRMNIPRTRTHKRGPRRSARDGGGEAARS